MEPGLSKDGSVHATDERINTITHLAGACLAVLGAALLVAEAVASGNAWKIAGLGIYSLSLVCLFVFSTLHHGINGGPTLNRVLRTFDYVSVFFLIAGTVTPLVLVLYRNVFGWAVLFAVWAIAVLGITLRSVHSHLPKHITNTFYIVLGWLTIALAGAGKMPAPALALMAAGGIVYSAGFVIYVIEKPNFMRSLFGFHELWHCMVVVAAVLHFLLMYFYVLPA